jgi:hypothetical protein
VIFVGLLVLGFLFYVFCSFWGFVVAALATKQSNKYKRLEAQGLLKHQRTSEPPSHVTLLTPPTPYDQEEDLAGWDGAEELDIETEEF